MLYKKLKTISVAATTALLAACAGGGGGTITAAPATTAQAPRAVTTPPAPASLAATGPTAPATTGVATPSAVPAGTFNGPGAATGPAATTPAVPPAGAPVTTQCAANTFCGVDAATVTVPLNITATGTITPANATVTNAGAPTALGATAFTAMLDPVTKNPTSATVSGGVNTSVATLTLQPSGSFAGTAADDQYVNVLAFGSNSFAFPATAANPAGGLVYSNFGGWNMAPLAPGQQTGYKSYWAGGTQLTTSMPTTGTATYAGFTIGTAWVNAAGTSTDYSLSGKVALTANFTPAGGVITGSITDILAFQNGFSFFNNIALDGTINGNGFTGTATAGAVPALPTTPTPTPVAIAVGTVGTTAGHFYGPAADEVTGVWSMSTSTVTAVGSFGAKPATTAPAAPAATTPAAPTLPVPPALAATGPAAPATTGVTTSSAVPTGTFYGPGAATGPVATTATPTVPSTVTPITTQCAANTFCGVDAATASYPLNNDPVTLATTYTGAPTVLGATTFAAVLDPVTGKPISATISGGINTSVATLSKMPAGSYRGLAANGLTFDMLAYGNPNALIGLPGIPATAASPSAGLTYSDFGDWYMYPNPTGQITEYKSHWAGGTQLTSAMPTTGTATYAGITVGTAWVNAAGTWTDYGLAGNVALTANFTSTGGTLTGNITGISASTVVAGLPFAAGAFNDVALAGTIVGNAFTGTATAGAVPATIPGPTPAAIAVGTTGTVGGHFYGPTANEVTGVWAMSAGNVQAMGSFGAKQ